MSRFLVVKNLGALRPVDEAGEEIMRHVGQGEIVAVEMKRPRNVAHHRRFFAMLSIILENQDYYKSVEDILDLCKLATGHCRTVRTRQGDVRIPESISFAEMDQDAFNSFYDRACAWVVQDVIPGLQRKHLDAEVEARLMAFGTPEG